MKDQHEKCRHEFRCAEKVAAGRLREAEIDLETSRESLKQSLVVIEEQRKEIVRLQEHFAAFRTDHPLRFEQVLQLIEAVAGKRE